MLILYSIRLVESPMCDVPEDAGVITRQFNRRFAGRVDRPYPGGSTNPTDLL